MFTSRTELIKASLGRCGALPHLVYRWLMILVISVLSQPGCAALRQDWAFWNSALGLFACVCVCVCECQCVCACVCTRTHECMHVCSHTSADINGPIMAQWHKTRTLVLYRGLYYACASNWTALCDVCTWLTLDKHLCWRQLCVRFIPFKIKYILLPGSIPMIYYTNILSYNGLKQIHS